MDDKIQIIDDDGSKKPRSGWLTAVEVVGWLIITLSGTCGGFFLLMGVSSDGYIPIFVVLIYSGVPIAIGTLLLYLARRKW